MKVKKSHIITTLSVVFVTVVAIAIQYFHFRGVKDALERLVEQKTNGQYRLDLGETTYDFLKLDFKLRDARIYRIDTINNERVYAVELPYVRINLGSLESYFGFGQINVKEFVVNEPVIVLQKQKLEKKKVRLSSELANLLNVVKEVLDAFNVHSFTIAKGSFTLKQDSETLRINLIDFLAKEWNVRKLTNQRQLRIKVGAQKLDIFNNHISFSRIDYSFRSRQLSISNFTYQRIDSISGARLNTKAQKFIVYHIDWDELSNAERYQLKKIELINPVVQGAFPLVTKKKNAGDFTRMLHDAVGEIAVDSIIVRDARLHFAYKQVQDSTSVSFQDASFRITDFKLLDTRDLFEVGQVLFNLNRTELTIGKKYMVRFDSLFFDHYQNRKLYVEGLEVAERNVLQPFIASRKVYISQFNPFDFLLDKKISAASLELNDSKVIVPPGLLGERKEPSMESTFRLDLNRFKLSNSNIYYNQDGRQASIENLNLSIRNIHLGRSSGSSFEFDELSARLLKYKDTKTKLNVNGQALQVKGKEIKAFSIAINNETGPSVLLRNVSVSTDGNYTAIPDQLPLLRVGKLEINGAISSTGKAQKLPKFKLDQLLVDSLLINVIAKDNAVHLQGSNLQVDGIQTDSLSLKWSQIQTEISALLLNNPEWLITATDSRINSSSHSLLNQFKIIKKDSTIEILTPMVTISPFTDFENWAEINLTKPVIKTELINGVADSVSLLNLSLLKKELAEVSIFHPSLTVNLNQTKSQNNKINHLELPAFLNNTQIQNAEIVIQSSRAPINIDHLNVQWRRNDLPNISIESIKTHSENFNWALSKAEFKSNQFSIVEISLTPRQTLEEYSTTGFERDWLNLNFKGLQLNGFVLDSLLFAKEKKVSELSVQSFNIDVWRDKRLPDPAFKEKPLFAKLLGELKQPLEIPTIRFADGSVNVNQISDKTNETGKIVINSIEGEIKNVISPASDDQKLRMEANAQIFGQGKIKVNYQVEQVDRFKLNVVAEQLDFSTFNSMIQPLQSVRFKSGRLKSLKIDAIANDSIATGTAIIDYRDLRIEILKADKTNLRNEIVSAIANEIIRNKRKNAVSELVQIHEKDKAEFTYWTKIVMRGAAGAARHGKKQKKK